jgi:hypothetical protein
MAYTGEISVMKRGAVIGSVILVFLSAAILAGCGGKGEEEEPTATPTTGTSAAAPAPGAPASAPMPGESGPPEEMIKIALQLVADREGLDLEELTLASATTDGYPLSGETAYSFKVTDTSTGELYYISLDTDGEEADSEALLADEEAAYTDKYGNLEAALFDELESAPPDEPINVTIWLEEPPYSPPPLPDLNKGLTPEQANAYLKLADEKRAEAVEKLTKPALDEISQMGLKAEADKYTPALQASLTPDEINKAQELEGLERIYLAPIFEPTLDVARDVVEADVYWPGFHGSGVKVAEVEVGGEINTDNPNLSGVTQDTTSSCQHAHAAAVAGIIRSSDETVRGIVPAASLWIGGSCGGYSDQLKSRLNAAADWGATVFNNSWGYPNCNFVSDLNKFVDDMVANRSRSVVFAAGNRGSYSDHCVTSPALAYNVIAVGASDDKNTLGWPDDTVADYSSYADPTTTHNDREEPDVMAPGTNFQSTTNADPWIGDIGSGTSYAAPIATGVIAQLMEQAPALLIHPAAVRAILMATAVHNIEGDARLSDKDGVGQIDSHFATKVLQGVDGQYMATTCGADSPSTSEYTVSLVAGRPTRIVLTWDVDPNYSSYSTQPSGDLDLQVINPAGQVVAQSTSFDNNYEFAYFTSATGGQYKLRVTRVRWDTPTTRGLGWAVYQGDPFLLPTPVPPTAGPSPTPKPTTAAAATLTPTPTPTRTPTPRPTATPTKTRTPGPSPTPKPPTKTPKPGTPRPTRGLPTPYM